MLPFPSASWTLAGDGGPPPAETKGISRNGPVSCCQWRGYGLPGAAEFNEQQLNPSIPRENLVIEGMQQACRRSAQCISFSGLLFPPVPFFQASITGDYSPLIVSFPPLFTAGARMSLTLSLFSHFNAIKYIPRRLFLRKGTWCFGETISMAYFS